jgi:hypothetical protein
MICRKISMSSAHCCHYFHLFFARCIPQYFTIPHRLLGAKVDGNFCKKPTKAKATSAVVPIRVAKIDSHCKVNRYYFIPGVFIFRQVRFPMFEMHTVAPRRTMFVQDISNLSKDVLYDQAIAIHIEATFSLTFSSSVDNREGVSTIDHVAKLSYHATRSIAETRLRVSQPLGIGLDTDAQALVQISEMKRIARLLQFRIRVRICNVYQHDDSVFICGHHPHYLLPALSFCRLLPNIQP